MSMHFQYHVRLVLTGASRGLSPEIVHFRIPNDGIGINMMAPSDWYIKGARWAFVIYKLLWFEF
jgi:hypothetical protein